MRILIIADGRSPITRGWINLVLQADHEVVLVSSSPADDVEGVKQQYCLPICFSKLAGSQADGGGSAPKKTLFSRFLKQHRESFQKLRYWLGPLSFLWYLPALRRIIKKEQPELIHALRVPFEGMFAQFASGRLPLAVSLWGNDLTLHANANLIMKMMTRKVLHRCNGLISDVQRDIELAKHWGFDHSTKPTLVALTSGGIDVDRIRSLAFDQPLPNEYKFSASQAVVCNPRGIRPAYIRNGTFFGAIPLIVNQLGEQVIFACPSMLGQPEAEYWIERHKIGQSVCLFAYLSQERLWQLMGRSQVMVSLSIHDGSPNTLLESMALGVFPVVGDIESLREWIVDGENGFLVDPDDSSAVAEAIIHALKDDDLRKKAAEINLALVKGRADRNQNLEKLEEFYSQIRNQAEVCPLE